MFGPRAVRGHPQTNLNIPHINKQLIHRDIIPHQLSLTRSPIIKGPKLFRRMATTSKPVMRVLISGAGIAGPTLAWFLAKAGAHVNVVEKAPTILTHGQNIDIEGSAITTIKKMGLMEEIRRNNTTEIGTQFIDKHGKPFAPFPVTDGKFSPTSEREILRADLARVLYEVSREQPNVKYQFDTTVTKVLSNDENAVKVELSTGEIQEYDLLVAADGQWSKIRKQVFAPESVTVRDMGMTAVYFTVPRQPEDNHWWNVYQSLRSRVITTRPDPYGTIRAMLTKMPRSDKEKQEWQQAARSDQKTQQELIRREFADAGWLAQRFLDSMPTGPDFYFHVIQQIKMSTWSNGRVVCLGDAACAPTPLTGAGTSLAIVSGYILAGEISKLSPGEHPGRALNAYEKLLKPFVEDVQNVPWFVPGIAHAETEFRRFLTSMFMRTLSIVVPWLPSWRHDGVGAALPHYDGLNDNDVDLADAEKGEFKGFKV